MSLINVDGTAISNYIDSLIFEELYKKAVLASKDDDDEDEDLAKILDDVFGEYGENTRESIPEENILDINIKIVFGSDEGIPRDCEDDYDDRADDSTLFNPN